VVTSSNNVLRQIRDELDKISEHIGTIDSCNSPSCPAQYPVDTLRVVIDLLEQIDHRTTVRYKLTQGILSGLNINIHADGPDQPGVILDQLMRARGFTNRGLAKALDITPKHINDLRRGHILPSPSMALKFERVGLSTAAEWNRMTSTYKDWLLRQKEEG
jgi:plasmid maintenance system antidote protein VapI